MMDNTDWWALNLSRSIKWDTYQYLFNWLCIHQIFNICLNNNHNIHKNNCRYMEKRNQSDGRFMVFSWFDMSPGNNIIYLNLPSGCISITFGHSLPAVYRRLNNNNNSKTCHKELIPPFTEINPSQQKPAQHNVRLTAIIIILLQWSPFAPLHHHRRRLLQRSHIVVTYT